MDSLAEVSGDGAFQRTASTFRGTVPSEKYPAAANRYSLFVSYACPWASRCLAALKLKGLEDAIDVASVHPTWQKTKPLDEADTHFGWAFRNPSDPPVSSPSGYGSFPCDEKCTRPRFGKSFDTIRDVYESQAGGGGKKFTVPILFDNERNEIVNNESSEIVRMLNAGFNEYAKHPEVDLRPTHLVERIDAVNEWVYDGINDGVYKCGFAKSQKAYNEAYAHLFASLDRAEGILSRQRYLCGNVLTEADLRLFVTLVRFDPVYVVYFKCNGKTIGEYSNLSRYVADIYAHEGIPDTVSISHIVTHYYTSHPTLNAYAIIPGGSRALPDYVLHPPPPDSSSGIRERLVDDAKADQT